MDIANEDHSVSLPLRLGRPEAGESSGPQIYPIATTHFGELHVTRHVGYTKGKGNGPTEGRYESIVRKHNGPLS